MRGDEFFTHHLASSCPHHTLIIMFKIKNPFSESWQEKIISILPKKRHYLAATIVVVVILGLFYSYQIVDASRNAMQIKKLSESFKQSIFLQNWEESQKILKSISANVEEIEGDIDRMFPFTVFPVISSEIRAIQNLLAASKISIISAEEVLVWVSDIPILSQKQIDLTTSVSEEDRIEILSALADSNSIWKNINDQTLLSLEFLKASQKTKIPIIAYQVNKLGSQLFAVQNLFSKIQPWLAILPQVIGHEKEKTYLLLLQNNTELRPTGGFIGTYGILKIKNGKVTEFTTDNVYNLDEPAKAYNTKIPPLALQKYIKQSQWFFRDVNWDPDFPTTAQNAIQFYKDEKGPVKNFDGVIALTPDLIESLLSVTGPVTVDNKEFTTENLIDTLAYHVELGFKEEGITIYNRKQIIDDVAQQLQEKLFSMSLDKIRELVPIVFNALDKKQVMFYFENDVVQSVVQEFYWDGRIRDTDEDYLYFVDANLGSLKSDPAINRTIKYTIEPVGDGTLVSSGGKLQATASITYEHTGDFNWKTTRYRTYTRLYAPLGSTLIEVSGNEEEISIADEHNKTVFGTFISIEPSNTETLSFTYTLPDNLATKILAGKYNLLIQKQAGTRAHNLEIDISLPFKIDEINPSNILDKKGGNQVVGEWNLEIDREIALMQ